MVDTKVACGSSLAMACAIALAAGQPASAHDIWLTADNTGEKTVAQVDFGDLVARENADPKKIVSLELLTSSGAIDLRAPLTPGQRLGHPVLSTRPFPAPAGAVVAVSYDNGFWIKLPGDKLETNASKIMAPKGTAAHMTVKYGKLLLGAGGYRTVVGSRLELVALKDPFALAAGQTLPVRLQLNGKPVPGAEIAYTDGLQPIPDAKQPTVKTDADGVAQVPAPRKGANLLTTDIETAPAHPALAGQDHIYASLAFDTSH